jgi:hypothetical protein
MATSQQRQKLAKQRQKAERELAKRRTIIVRHYTKPHWLDKILADGVIKTEGCNVIEAQPNYQALMMQYRLVGRYVWFTEGSADSVVAQQHSVGITSADLPYIEFAADSIVIERWPDIRRQFSGMALEVARAMDNSAIAMGDNPSKWWVGKQPVPLDKALRVSKGTANAEMIGNPYELFGKV